MSFGMNEEELYEWWIGYCKEQNISNSSYLKTNQRRQKQVKISISLIMFKNIKVTNLVYEMLMELSKKSRPQQKPELLLEQLIKDRYNTIK